MTPRLTAETFCFAPAQTLASPSTVRWSSAVDSTPSSWRAQASPTICSILLVLAPQSAS